VRVLAANRCLSTVLKHRRELCELAVLGVRPSDQLATMRPVGTNRPGWSAHAVGGPFVRAQLLLYAALLCILDPVFVALHCTVPALAYMSQGSAHIQGSTLSWCSCTAHMMRVSPFQLAPELPSVAIHFITYQLAAADKTLHSSKTLQR
jgi:hypothetical protein